MFGSKRKKESKDVAPAAAVPQMPVSSGGYVSSELPTFHGRERKVIVYTTDAKGRIIKTIRKK